MYVHMCVSSEIIFMFSLHRNFAIPSLLTGKQYRGADKSLARPTSQCILFDG
jgi:hypothetical protein